jgi:hypothetical protein
LLYKNNCENIENTEELDEDKLKNDFFIPEIKEINEENQYKNYEKDSIITKDSIDIILDEREENYKHKLNLKEAKLKNQKETIIDKTFLNVANNMKKKNKQDLKIIE